MAAGQLPALSAYKMIPPATLAGILAVSKLDKNLLPTDASDSYSAAVRDAASKMAALADGDVVFQDRTAAQLGRIAWVQNAASGTPTKNARDALEELPRNDIKAVGSPPRNGGKLWYAANYRNCGKPAAGTCWGW